MINEQNIGKMLEGLFMLRELSKKDYDLLEPCVYIYGPPPHHPERLTDKQRELIITIHSRYFQV
jgi:hypothetical protein